MHYIFYNDYIIIQSIILTCITDFVLPIVFLKMKYNYCVYLQNKWKYLSTNFNFFVSTRFLWCNIKILVTQHKKQLCIMVEYANFFKAYRIWLFVIIAQLNAFGVIMHRIFKVYMGCEYKLKETWFHNSHGCKFCSWWTPVE